MSTTKKTTNSTKFDPKQASLFTKNYGDAQGTAAIPFTPYTGEMVAPLSANENLAIANAPSMFSAGMPANQAAQDTAYGLTNYQAPQAQAAMARAAQLGHAPQASSFDAEASLLKNAPQVGPVSINRGDIGNLSGGDLMEGINKYQNPFTSGVIDTTLSDLERSREMQRVADQQKTPMGAFGGSRQGVADAQTNEAYQRTAASTLAGLRQAGFDKAAGLAESDAQRGLAASSANQNADLSVASRNADYAMQGGQFNAGMIGDFLRSNQAAENTASESNAARRTGTSAYNTGVSADFAKTNAANRQQVNLFNAGNLTDLSKFNSSADMNAADMRRASAGLLGDLGGQERAGVLDALNANLTTGGLERGQQQQADAAAMQEFTRQMNFPLQQQLLRDSSLDSIKPILESTTTNKETTGGMGPIMQALGGLAMGVGTMGMGLPAMGAMGGLGGLFGGGMGAMNMTPQIFGSNVGGYMGR